MRFRLCRFALLWAFLLALGVAPLSATVLYDNGPINGNSNGWTVDGGHNVTNSFQLSSASTVTGAVFGAWGFPGRPGLSVVWAITSTPYGAPLASGEATLSNEFLFTNSSVPSPASVWRESFDIPALSLGAGTYWLEFDDTWADGYYWLMWDQNNGPSQAEFRNSSGTYSIGSESFQILGSVAPAQATPEPGSAVLLGCGALLLGIAVIGKRKLNSPGR